MFQHDNRKSLSASDGLSEEVRGELGSDPGWMRAALRYRKLINGDGKFEPYWTFSKSPFHQ